MILTQWIRNWWSFCCLMPWQKWPIEIDWTRRIPWILFFLLPLHRAAKALDVCEKLYEIQISCIAFIFDYNNHRCVNKCYFVFDSTIFFYTFWSYLSIFHAFWLHQFSLFFFTFVCHIKIRMFSNGFCDIMDHEPESFGWFKFHIRFAWIFANTYTLYLNMYDMYAGWSLFACINVYLRCIITMYTRKIIGTWKNGYSCHNAFK